MVCRWKIRQNFDFAKFLVRQSHCYQKVCLSNSFSDFFKNKKWFHWILLFFVFANIFLGEWVLLSTVWAHFQDGGWDTGIGKFRSIYPNSGILIENHLAGKAVQNVLAKSKFGEFTLMEKYTQLIFIEHNWRSQTFDKPSYCLMIYNGFKKNIWPVYLVRPVLVFTQIIS